MRIIIETVPKDNIRNEQVGDYFYLEDGTLQINVADLGDERMELLVCMHEFWEAVTSEANGVKEEDISKFDEEYEKKRRAGLVPEDSDNGFAKDCNYKIFHTRATAIEMLLSVELGIDWIDYENKLNSI